MPWLAAGCLALAAASSLATVDAAVAVEAMAPIVVEIDHATLIQMPARRRILVFDNPRIVRATYLPEGDRAVLTGISYGETRMMVLGNAGEVVATSTVRVLEAADAAVTVYRGQERGTYVDCDRLCQPRLRLGDADKQFGNAVGQIRSREPRQVEPPHTESGAHL